MSLQYRTDKLCANIQELINLQNWVLQTESEYAKNTLKEAMDAIVELNEECGVLRTKNDQLLKYKHAIEQIADIFNKEFK